MQHLAPIVFEIIDRLGNIRVRFTPAFSCFEDFPCGELPTPLPHNLGGGEKKLCALRRCLSAPVWKKTRRAFDGTFYITARGDAHSANNFVGIGGIERRKCLS